MPLRTGRSADQRIRRTRERLTQALLDLSEQRRLAEISVRELTDYAGVGYATFFRHYAGIDDLLRATIGDLYDELIGLLPPLAGQDPAAAGAAVFRHVGEHPQLYRLLLHGGELIRDQLVDVGTAGLLGSYQPHPQASVPADIAADHFIRAFLDLIDWWLRHDRPHPPERMGVIYRDLILRPVEATALQPRPPA